MSWIRKTTIFVSLLVIAFFACQANEFQASKIGNQKADPIFSIENIDSSYFIQPQTAYHFAANIKVSDPNIIKWFDSLLISVPDYQALKFTSNFANQFLNQSQKISLLLYPFHYFW